MSMPAGRRPPPIDAAALRDHLEDALDHWFTGTGGWLPAVDLIRCPNELVVRADVPGVRLDDLRIEADAATLTISGERQAPDVAEDASYLRDERRSGSFSRSLALPTSVDAARIDARLENGVLEVILPFRAGADTKPIQVRPRQ